MLRHRTVYMPCGWSCCLLLPDARVLLCSAADVDWDEALNRVSFAAFGCSRYVKSSDVADPAGKTLNPVVEAKRQKDERMERLRNPLDPRIRLLEDEVMEKLWCSRLGDSPPAERDAMDSTLRLPETQELWRKLREECGISNGFAACYFLYSLVESEEKRAAGGGETESEEAARRRQFLDSECRNTFGQGRVTSTAVLLSSDSVAVGTDGTAEVGRQVDLHAAVKEKEQIAQEAGATTVDKQTTATTAGTRAAAVAGQAVFQGSMRATVRTSQSQMLAHIRPQHLCGLPSDCLLWRFRGTGQCRDNACPRHSGCRRCN